MASKSFIFIAVKLTAHYDPQKFYQFEILANWTIRCQLLVCLYELAGYVVGAVFVGKYQ